jgi:hypothetical protein
MIYGSGEFDETSTPPNLNQNSWKLGQEESSSYLDLLLETKMYRTPWKIDTTEETSGSLLATVAVGALYLSNEDTGEQMKINYRCISLGAGKGPPAGANWSNTADPSGGFDNVAVIPGRYFSSLSFPCRGYMIGVGASAGVIGSILGMDVTGDGLTAVLFGILPVFAGVRIWGFGRGALPGAGITGGLAVFEVE